MSRGKYHLLSTLRRPWFAAVWGGFIGWQRPVRCKFAEPVSTASILRFSALGPSIPSLCHKCNGGPGKCLLRRGGEGRQLTGSAGQDPKMGKT